MKKRIAAFCAVGLLAGLGGTASADIMTSWGGSEYAVITQWNGTWDQAREAIWGSLGNDWELAAITSQDEHNFLASMLADNSLTGEFWLGARQRDPLPGGDSMDGESLAPDDGWEWITGENWDFSAWAADEPNDWMGINEQYLGMRSTEDWRWNDEHGNANITGFVAERLAPAPVPEPASMFLVGTGLLGLAGLRRRTRK